MGYPWSDGQVVSAADLNALYEAAGGEVALAGSGRQGLPGRLLAGRKDGSLATGDYSFTWFRVARPITITKLVFSTYGKTGSGGVLRCAAYAATHMLATGSLVKSLGSVVPNGSMQTVDISEALGVGDYFLVTHTDFEGTVSALSSRQRHYLGGVMPTSTDQEFQRLTLNQTWPGSWPSTLSPSVSTAHNPGDQWGAYGGGDYNPAALVWTE